jgi:hypothetical protein
MNYSSRCWFHAGCGTNSLVFIKATRRARQLACPSSKTPTREVRSLGDEQPITDPAIEWPHHYCSKTCLFLLPRATISISGSSRCGTSFFSDLPTDVKPEIARSFRFARKGRLHRKTEKKCPRFVSKVQVVLCSAILPRNGSWNTWPFYSRCSR